LRNSLNVALPVTANFIDPRMHQSRSVTPGKAADTAQRFTVAKGSQVIKLTLPAGSPGRHCNLFWCLEGMAA
jgi:hypothetical protein